MSSQRSFQDHSATIRIGFVSIMGTMWRVPRLVLVGIVRLYQMGISPYFPSTCRYTPTCSQYTIQSLKEYGAVRGTILATWRILRCNPWGGHGHDPPLWFGEKRDNEVESAKSGLAT